MASKGTLQNGESKSQGSGVSQEEIILQSQQSQQQLYSDREESSEYDKNSESPSTNQQNSTRMVGKKRMDEAELKIFKEIVQLIFEADFDSLSNTLQKHPPQLIEKLMNKCDQDGATVLFIAVKLAHRNPPQYHKIVELLTQMGANARRPDRDFSTCMKESIQQCDRELALKVLQGIDIQREKQRPGMYKLKEEFDATLEQLPDFSFELCYSVESSVIPLVNRITPSDRIKITKYKNHVRFESTFAGYEGFSIKRRDIKSVYNPLYRENDLGLTLPPFMRQVVLFVGDETKKYTFPVHPLTQEEKIHYIDRMIKRQEKKREKGKEGRWRTMRINEIAFSESKGFFGGLKQEQMFNFDTQKFDLKVVCDFLVMQRQSNLFQSTFQTYWEQNQSFFSLEDTNILNLINYDKYNKQNLLNELIQDLNEEINPYQSRAHKVVEKETKNQTLGIWITKSYPLKFKDLQMLIKTMINQLENDTQLDILKHLEALLQDRNLTQFMDLEHAFPVKLQVPFRYTFYADITFQNFYTLPPLSEQQASALFTVPQDYQHVERLQMAKELGIGEGKKKILENEEDND